MQFRAVVSWRPRRRVLVIALLVCTVLLCYMYMVRTQLGQLGKTKQVTKGQNLLSNDVTLVTCHLNLGSLQKAEGNFNHKSKDNHDGWKMFHLITNPVIAFFDNDQDAEDFKIIRNKMPTSMTKVVKISKDDSWAFSLQKSIELIFSQQSYPNHDPNAVLPDYSCAMHAKYEFMEMALKENAFNTKYFAWLDMGYFRDLETMNVQPFTIYLPPEFDEQKVAYGEMHPPSNTPLTANQIVEANLVWVCGSFFVAKYDVMLRWTNQYRVFTEKMLKETWMGTDQQVLYYMFQPQHNQSALMDVHIQTYNSHSHVHPCLYLGYFCAKPSQKRWPHRHRAPAYVIIDS